MSTSGMRIERRHGREYVVGMLPTWNVCREECDGFQCTLEKGHDGDEHIATGLWDLRGSEVYKRWPVAHGEDGGAK